MKRFIKILSTITFCTQVLLVFLLLFQHKVVVPVWLQALGRTHPLVLHLPIGILIITTLVHLLRKHFEGAGFHNLFGLLLHTTALSAAVTALFGFLLSKEGGYSQGTLFLHKLTGVLFSITTSGLLLLYLYAPAKKIIFNLALLAGFVLMILSGHWGAVLTHGEDFILQPFQKDEQPPTGIINDSTPLYTAVIEPIFKTKCYACHNEKKAKGGLVMTSATQLLKGGKNGPALVPGNGAGSLIIQYIHLPEEDKKHMPPPGKPQLNDTEKLMLHAWIQSGASMKMPLKAYPAGDSIAKLAAGLLNNQPALAGPAYPFKSASPGTVQKLNTPFCTVSPLSVSSPALEASFFVRQQFNINKLEALRAVKEQLVSLNLNNMPVTDREMDLVAGFTNLEKLSLNNTGITGRSLPVLSKLNKLQWLALAGTKVDNNIAAALKQLPALKEVFVWNTAINAAALQQQLPGVRVNTGFIPDAGEILRLNSPVVKNNNFVVSRGDSIRLSHPLPGATILYTVNGLPPDSVQSPAYRQPIAVNGFTSFKAIAVKPGWYASEMVEFNFFSNGLQPDTAVLLTPPNDQYKGGGAAILIDGKKGLADNFRDAAWLGYREQPFSALVFFNNPAPVVNTITISYAKNIGSYIMPPAWVEVWAGADKNHLKILKSVKPVQPVKLMNNVVEGISVTVPPAAYNCLKIVVKPVNPLPAWHPGKGDKGWVFIDEIFFN